MALIAIARRTRVARSRALRRDAKTTRWNRRFLPVRCCIARACVKPRAPKTMRRTTKSLRGRDDVEQRRVPRRARRASGALSLEKTLTSASVNAMPPARSMRRRARYAASKRARRSAARRCAISVRELPASRKPRLNPWPATGCSACAALPIETTARPSVVRPAYAEPERCSATRGPACEAAQRARRSARASARGSARRSPRSRPRRARRGRPSRRARSPVRERQQRERALGREALVRDARVRRSRFEPARRSRSGRSRASRRRRRRPGLPSATRRADARRPRVPRRPYHSARRATRMRSPSSRQPVTRAAQHRAGRGGRRRAPRQQRRVIDDVAERRHAGSSRRISVRPKRPRCETWIVSIGVATRSSQTPIVRGSAGCRATARAAGTAPRGASRAPRRAAPRAPTARAGRERERRADRPAARDRATSQVSSRSRGIAHQRFDVVRSTSARRR